MIPRLTFRPATRADAEHIAVNLRIADWEELYYSSGNPEVAVVLAAVVSEFCWVGLHGGEPVCIFGVAEVSDDLGSPWMVGTPKLMLHRKEIVVEGKRYVNVMRRLYPRLENWVSAENTTSIEWLRAMGFTIGTLHTHHGMAKQPFYKFYTDDTQHV